MYKGNPFNNMNPMQQQFSMGNIKQSFSQPTPLIDRPDFQNKNNVLHNNISSNLLAEHVMEYKIHISSADRNTQSYPSPFKMKVSFGSNLAKMAPLIDKGFSNVKYVSIDSIILPRTIALDISDVTSDPPIIYPTGSTYPSSTPLNPSNKLHVLENNKYIIVKINELCTDKNKGTSVLFDRDTFTFIMDTDLGFDSVLWKPLHNNRVIFQNSLLANLNTLTFTVFDQFGNELKLYDQLGRNIIGTRITGLTVDYNQFMDDNSSEPSVEYTNNVMQVNYNLTFGVVENELNTMTNY